MWFPFFQEQLMKADFYYFIFKTATKITSESLSQIFLSERVAVHKLTVDPSAGIAQYSYKF